MIPHCRCRELEGLLDWSFGTRTEKATIVSGAMQTIARLDTENSEIREEIRRTSEVVDLLKQWIDRAMAVGMLSGYVIREGRYVID